VLEEPEGPKDHNHDPFCFQFSAKINKNLRNMPLFGDFSNFLQVCLKTSGKTDHGCDS
jgi:hypothetical protein